MFTHSVEYYTVIQNSYKPILEKLGSMLSERRSGQEMMDTYHLFLDTFAYNVYSICM